MFPYNINRNFQSENIGMDEFYFNWRPTLRFLAAQNRVEESEKYTKYKTKKSGKIIKKHK